MREVLPFSKDDDLSALILYRQWREKIRDEWGAGITQPMDDAPVEESTDAPAQAVTEDQQE